MARQQDGAPKAGEETQGAAATAVVQPPDSNEARIAEQRLRDLQQQASDAVAEMQKVKGDVTALTGELERAKTEIAGLKAANERLEGANRQLAESSTARDGLPGLPVELPKGAFQLVESVTIASVGDSGKPVRATPKRGDVVFVAGSKRDVEELQAELGLVAHVYAIDRSTAEELRALKAIR
jgi:hypothetical protein